MKAKPSRNGTLEAILLTAGAASSKAGFRRKSLRFLQIGKNIGYS